MRAIRIPGWGEPPVVADGVPEPERPPGSALVRLRAAGLNPVDLAIGSGRFYGQVPEPPFTAGAEAVGEVVASDHLPAGTRVWCLTATGAFAELLAVADDHLVPVPNGIDDPTAAAIGIAGLAGWMSVVVRGGLQPGETVLVLGASGVVGQVAVQAARVRGAGRIVAAARSQEGLARATTLGADAAVTLAEGADLATGLRDACAPGADVVIDTLWGEPVQAALAAGRTGCRFVQVGNAAGPTAAITGGTLRGGRFDIRGFSVFTETAEDRARAYRELAEAAAAGRVAIDVETVPLDQAPDAWARQAGGTAGRKLVLLA